MAFDCIVIGLGGVGAAVLDQLARRGLSVLGIEQFGVAHDRGSSHGETRIIRKAYFEHPDYVPLLQRAYELWAEAERLSGRRLYVRTGLILSGPPGGAAVPGALRAAREHRLAVGSLSYAEARRQYPQFRFPEDHQVLVEEDAGYLLVEQCVRSFAELAIGNGAQVYWNEPVHAWGSNGRTGWVESGSGRFEAKRLVVAGGAWMSRLMPGALPPLKVLRKVQFWHSVRPDPGASGGLPAFYFEVRDDAFYGIPSADGSSVKVAQHTGGGEVADPAKLDRDCHEADRQPVRRFLEAVLPAAAANPTRHAVCMYTMSPDEHFIVDRHPEYGNVFFAAGLSGHGFKFTSVLGSALADLVSEGNTALPIGFLSAARFAR